MTRLLGCLTAAVLASLVLSGSASASVRWFHSPNGNLSCEVSSGGARGAYAFCQSERTPKSVTLSRDGRWKICRGVACLGDPPVEARALGYGRSIRVGAFSCRSERSGMRCVVVRSGRGFKLSRDAIERVRDHQARDHCAASRAFAGHGRALRRTGGILRTCRTATA